MTDREKATEIVLGALGYEPKRIERAMAMLTGHDQHVTRDHPLLTPRELCQKLKISITTLWRLDPPHILVGTRKRYRLCEVEEWIMEKK